MTETLSNELTITREINAPRDLVFKAFTQAEHLAHWWGPKGFKLIVSSLDLRPDGVFLYCMQAPDGNEMWGKFVYREISAPEKIVFINSFSDKDGNTVRAPFSANWPLEVLNVWTLTEAKGKTTLTLKGHPINASEEEMKMYGEMHSSMNQGFNGTFDQLDAYLASL